MNSVRNLVALHDHLDGGVRAETLCELADRYGGVLKGRVASDVQQRLVQGARLGGSLMAYLEPFEWVTDVLRSYEDLHRVAREAVQDLFADGVRHAEIRFAPRLYERWGIELDDAIEAVSDGVIGEAARLGMSAGVIVCGMRHESDLMAEARAVKRWHHREVVLGFDIAGDESRYGVREHHDAIAWLVSCDVPVTIHAGEARGWESVRDALQASSWKARIGHGVRAVENVAFLGELTDRGVHLEVCPSSNVHTGVVAELADHPLRALFADGVQVSVSADNRSMSDTTTSGELLQVAETFSWTEHDVRAVQLMAVEAAWCEPSTKAWLKGFLQDSPPS